MVNEIVVNEICWRTEKNGFEEPSERAECAETTRQLVSYCLVAVIKLMEITRVSAREVEEKCGRKQGKFARGHYIFHM